MNDSITLIEETNKRKTNLFFKIWKNVYTRNLILKHLRLFNLFPFSIDSKLKFQSKILEDNKNHINSISIKSRVIPRVGDKKIDLDVLFKKFEGISEWVESIEFEILSNVPFLSDSFDSIKLTDHQVKCINKVKSITINSYLNQNNKLEYLNYFSNLVSLDLKECLYLNTYEGLFPKQLKNLKLIDKSNLKILKNQLPIGLETIEFGSYFNHPIDGFLPNSIKSIKFPIDCDFDKPIDSYMLPKSLTKLSLPRDFNCSLIKGALPNTILKLKLPNFLSRTNKMLEFKIFEKNGNINSNEHLSKFIKHSYMIPPSVTQLSIIDCKEELIQHNINSLHLVFDKNNKYDQFYKEFLNFDNDIIKSIDIISLIDNKPLDVVYIKHIDINCFKGLINLNLSKFQYNSCKKPIKNFKVFPNLKCLNLGEYKSPLNEHSLPSTLELLELPSNFKQPINKKWLPPLIKHLIIKDNNTPISIENLPHSLESIWIRNDHYQLKQFQFFIPSLGKLKIVQENKIHLVYKKILKKDYQKYY
ncbi:hypothetical protein ACTA71_011548 [Dictyostelium dimigraforme]